MAAEWKSQELKSKKQKKHNFKTKVSFKHIFQAEFRLL